MDIVHLLPESVANQIAAGEVVQRPASVVKELVENSVDAGATKISVILKDGGRSVIQVIDNGKGMSPKDCEMAFMRHATSKISQATDLFSIATFGFRGEALASIASVAQVELRSRREESELGTKYTIAASEPQGCEPVTMAVGTNIRVRDLFYNIPARRKFLKAESTELRNIIQEFIRVALAHPDIEFRLSNNEKELYNLPAAILRKRIVSIFGKNIESKLMPIKCETGLLSINGYICIPSHSKKSHGEQFFFTNGRYMRHPAFHKAVTEAYGGLLPGDALPSYFLYFTVNPETIDVNIHPTKTEIKFQHESDCFVLIQTSIKEVLGKYNITASLDFDREGDIGYIEPSPEKAGNYAPGIRVNNGYNPFSKYGGGGRSTNSAITPAFNDFQDSHRKESVEGWEQLFEGLKDSANEVREQQLEIEPIAENNEQTILWAKSHDRYIIASMKQGVAIIDKRAAHIRVLYDKYRMSLDSRLVGKQSVMFPETIELNVEEALILTELLPQLANMGFNCTQLTDTTFQIESIPADFSEKSAIPVIMQLIETFNTGEKIAERNKERIALAMAQSTAIKANDPLSDLESESLIYDLLNCDQSHITPDGKRIITIMNNSELQNLL